MKYKKSSYLLFLLMLLSTANIFAQPGQRILAVIAHPDDESIFSVTLYKLAKEQHATLDLFVITNGEAGYKYSTLAEQYYGCKLTTAADAKKRLPTIRKKELHEGGKVIGISNYYFADQSDSHYTLNEREPLDTSWQVIKVRKQLHELLLHNHYNEVFCILPEAETHGGHKAATLLALDEVAALPADNRPLIFGAALHDKGDTARKFSALKGYSLTKTTSSLPSFVVDRTVSFSYLNRINYKIIANWELAAHKSQGATQMTMNDGDLEEFWSFNINTVNKKDEADSLFAKLNQSPYKTDEPKLVNPALALQLQQK
ncbi:PIG-L family deacetylase [Mucilaginibacter corticis]|uniref:PIG-L family deacetylase n=1 Tax=Mucilaginibacter corticis TaxID=2597670 RepID=A0A556MTK7_9SPHI|nr:PIG-L family deacetylase [Mucilaginibacter corticis]TSJ43263.1 PIG-L family deacetylase [Mucilaginibacter corticis]